MLSAIIGYPTALGREILGTIMNILLQGSAGFIKPKPTPPVIGHMISLGAAL
jgi:hypothetical protein